MTISLYIDADACPVKAEIYRVAERYGLKVHVATLDETIQKLRRQGT